MHPILSLPCCVRKSLLILPTHSPISTGAINTSSLAARARRSRLLVTDCYVFNEPEENKKFEGCGAIQVCCSVCQIHANSDNSQMFGSSFFKEIYVRCRTRKFVPGVCGRRRWQREQRFPGPRGLRPCLRGCATAVPSSCQCNVDGNEWTNSRETCLSVARRINKGSGFIFQEPRSSLKAISQLRNETPEIAQEQKYFGLMQTVVS